MTEDKRLQSIESKLDSHGDKLNEISITLQKLAVQDERIRNIEASLLLVRKEWDQFTDPKGALPAIQQWQASCPRNQISWMWGVIIGLSVLMFGIGVNLLRG